MNKDLAKAQTQIQAIAVIQREEGNPITITFQDVKNLINPMATDAEARLFLKMCESEQLNPFEGEIYLIKYSLNDKPAFVKSIDVYIKRSEKNPQYNGSEEGVILKTKNPQTGNWESLFREGEFIIDEEEPFLVGGWCRVYRKDREKPFYSAVRLSEYIRYKRDGGVQANWKEKPATMIVKVAKMRSLKHAFPNKPGDLATEDEISDEGLKPAYMKNGQPDWLKFWGKTKEMGWSDEEVHKILQVESMKEWLAYGNRTLEGAIESLQMWQNGGKTKEVRQAFISDWMKQEGEYHEVHNENSGGDGKDTSATEAPAVTKPEGAAGPDPNTVEQLITMAVALGVSEKDLLAQIGVKSREEIKNIPAAWRTAKAFGEFLSKQAKAK